MHQNTHLEEPYRRSVRLLGYDYRQSGFYFVTVCVKDKRWLLGEIINDNVRLSPIGSIVELLWNTLPDRFSSVTLDHYVVMPNHFHGIIIFNAPASLVLESRDASNIPTRFRRSLYREETVDDRAEKEVGSVSVSSQKQTSTDQQSVVPTKIKTPSLGEVIRTFKGAATYRIRTTIRQDFAWQDRLHEHIIRNDQDLQRIRQYIVDNPQKWTEDSLLKNQKPL